MRIYSPEQLGCTCALLQWSFIPVSLHNIRVAPNIWACTGSALSTWLDRHLVFSEIVCKLDLALVSLDKREIDSSWQLPYV